MGKLSELGLCLETLVNTISFGRKMILTLHNRELVLSFKDTKLCSCVFYFQSETESERVCSYFVYCEAGEGEEEEEEEEENSSQVKGGRRAVK